MEIRATTILFAKQKARQKRDEEKRLFTTAQYLARTANFTWFSVA